MKVWPENLILILILKRQCSNAYKDHIIGLEWKISKLAGQEKELKHE